MIDVDRITKRYGDITAVDEVSFQIEKGEIVGLLGPNGAGKTSVLRMITGYMHPDEGTVRVSDYDTMDQLLEAQRQIGYLPEFSPLYEDMELVEYLRFVAGCRDIPKSEWNHRIGEIAEKCDIQEQLHRPIEYLSKGYKQRVGLAQALLHRPEYLILDEPTTGLDPNQILDFRDVIKEVGEEHTVLLSTHILQEVSALCDRIIVIHEGKIAADGSQEELLRQHGENKLFVGIRRKNGTPDWDQVESKLSNLPYTSSVSRGPIGGDEEGQRFHLTLGKESPEDPGEDVFEMAKEEDWRVTEISSQKPNLETVFANLTQPDR